MLLRFFRLSTLLLLFAAIGCTTDKETTESVRRAERIGLDAPDSALLVMQSIDPSTIRTKQDMAYYTLVYCETLYYNYSEGNDDSLTMPLAQYYMASNNHNERSRAMFQHAVVKKNGGNFDDAMYYFLEAEKSLKEYKNARLKALVYRSKGYIYGAEYLFNNALSEHLAAKECFVTAASEYNIAYTNYDIGKTYLCLQQYSQAEEYLSDALAYAEENAIDNLAAESVNSLLDVYTSKMQYDRLAEFFEKYERYIALDEMTLYRYRAIRNAYRGDEKSAVDDLFQAELCGCEMIHIEHTSYIVYDIIGNDKLALDYLERCIRRQNNQIIVSLDAPILNMQVELGIQERIELQLRNKYEKLILIFIIVIVVIVLSCFTYIKLIRKKAEVEHLKKQVESTLNDLEAQANRVKSLTAIANDKEQRLSSMRKNIDELISRELSRISDLLDAYYSDVTKSVKHNQVIAELDNYIREFANSPKGYIAVEQYVNESLDDIMSKLRSEIPTFKEKEYRLLCLIYADFSSNAICMFMGYDKNKLYKHKSKLKATIAASDAPSRALFIENLG